MKVGMGHRDREGVWTVGENKDIMSPNGQNHRKESILDKEAGRGYKHQKELTCTHKGALGRF